ncbi:MAG: MliC family protein [Bacteroidales bacterium]|jgi:membrane-bound inhibitor of C-type lysozyme|nr:MliC family protein [Bacteroidales bacterium]
MTTRLLTFVVLIALAFASCNGNTKSDTQKTNRVETTAEKIVKASVTNKDGVTLDMEFNNSKGTATFLFKGIKIELKQDTTASGIKYSNSNYEYTEWHGELSLKKDGKEIFTHRN